MKTYRNLLRGAAALGALAAALSGQEGLTPKGVYRDNTNTSVKNGVTYRVMLARGAQQSEVPVSFAFRSGDRFRLQVKLKDDAYIYVLNRTLDGDPEQMASKGITVVRDEDRQQKTKRRKAAYTLLYPSPSEANRKIRKGAYRDIPGTELLAMDNNPGVEKVYVVLSDAPLDLTKYFRDGQMVSASGGDRTADDKGRKSDNPGDAIDNLDRNLADWAQNSATEPPAQAASKGVIREGSDEGEGCTVGNRNKPIMAEISLKHFAN